MANPATSPCVVDDLNEEDGPPEVSPPPRAAAAAQLATRPPVSRMGRSDGALFVWD